MTHRGKASFKCHDQLKVLNQTCNVNVCLKVVNGYLTVLKYQKIHLKPEQTLSISITTEKKGKAELATDKVTEYGFTLDPAKFPFPVELSDPV